MLIRKNRSRRGTALIEYAVLDAGMAGSAANPNDFRLVGDGNGAILEDLVIEP